LHELRAEQNLLALSAVRKNAAEKREQDDGDGAEELIESQEERRAGKLQHQPALRERLHQRADAGRARAYPHDAEIAVTKCFENSR